MDSGYGGLCASSYSSDKKHPPYTSTPLLKRNNEDAGIVYKTEPQSGPKKPKQDGYIGEGVSKVIHLRSLPDDCSTEEIVSLALPFKEHGQIVDMMHLRSKNQALMELDTIEYANHIVTHYTQNPPSIRQRTVYFQYSNHKELKTDMSPGQQKIRQELQQLQQSEGGANHVLRVVVENRQYPVTLDALHQIFSKFGFVKKIITFTKNAQYQALIQMADDVIAQTAKLSLDGQNIYTNCCTLRIAYSKMTSLKVKYNNDKSFDYTRPNLPRGETDGMMDMMGQQQMNQLNSMHMMMNGHAMMNMQQHQGMMHQQNMMSPMSQINPTQFSTQQPPHPPQPPQQQAVLLVSNLNSEKITCYDLFILFGVYGNVVRVKILFNKKDNALLQMSDIQQSETAMNYLKDKIVHGKPLRIIRSKHQHVQMPKEGQEAANLTQDYTNSPLHRFKKPGSKNFQNIHPPSETLHLSNIPQDVTEQELREKFEAIGTTVEDFRFFQKDRRMALIQLGSIEEAVGSLMRLHNTKLSETNHLRVSFSRTQLIQPPNQALQQ